MATLASDAPEPKVSKWRNVGFAVIVTFILSRSVIERWHSYGLFDKCYSVLVLLFVLTLPWQDIRMKKRAQNLEVWYVCILLMMVISILR